MYVVYIVGGVFQPLYYSFFSLKQILYRLFFFSYYTVELKNIGFERLMA